MDGETNVDTDIDSRDRSQSEPPPLPSEEGGNSSRKSNLDDTVPSLPSLPPSAKKGARNVAQATNGHCWDSSAAAAAHILQPPLGCNVSVTSDSVHQPQPRSHESHPSGSDRSSTSTYDWLDSAMNEYHAATQHVQQQRSQQPVSWGGNGTGNSHAFIDSKGTASDVAASFLKSLHDTSSSALLTTLDGMLQQQQHVASASQSPPSNAIPHTPTAARSAPLSSTLPPPFASTPQACAASLPSNPSASSSTSTSILPLPGTEIPASRTLYPPCRSLHDVVSAAEPGNNATAHANCSNASTLPSHVASSIHSSRTSVAEFDSLIHSKVDLELNPSVLEHAELVIGIPFYTELTNIHSVLICLREAIVRRKTPTLMVVMGEYARLDCVQQIEDLLEIENGEAWEHQQQQQQHQQREHGADHATQTQNGDPSLPLVSIATMWKPHVRYASKPWTVRALQIIASRAGPVLEEASTVASATTRSVRPRRRGAHLIILDADIQFNHFELSAQSLIGALLEPLQAWENVNENQNLRMKNRWQRWGQRLQANKSTDIDPATSTIPEPVLHSASPISPASPSIPPLPVCRHACDAPMPSPLPRRSHEPNRCVSFSPVFPVRCPEDYAHASALVSSHPASSSSDHSPMCRAPASCFVLLNAPRSFVSDDGIVHVMTYLYTFMLLGVEMHQSHGGEFSLHRDFNRAILEDESAVGGGIEYAACYCVENQLAHRAAFIHPITHPHLFPSLRKEYDEYKQFCHSQDKRNGEAQLQQSSASDHCNGDGTKSAELYEAWQNGCSVLEVLMKGKWHAKITLSKLLALEGGKPSANPAPQTSAPNGPSGLSPSPSLSPYPSPLSPPLQPPKPTSTPPLNASVVPPVTRSPPTSIRPASRARIDLVSEKLMRESMLLGSLGLLSPAAFSVRPVLHHSGGGSIQPRCATRSDSECSGSPSPPPPLPPSSPVSYAASVMSSSSSSLAPDPRSQSMKVLAPMSARKQMMKALKVYYNILIDEFVRMQAEKQSYAFPPHSTFVRRFLPMLHQTVLQHSSHDAVTLIVPCAPPPAPVPSHQPNGSHADSVSVSVCDRLFVFGADEWADATIELLQIYRQAQTEHQRHMVLSGHRLVWLVGCIALLNAHSHCFWGHLHSTLHESYVPTFRRVYLRRFIGLDERRVDDIMQQEMKAGGATFQSTMTI